MDLTVDEFVIADPPAAWAAAGFTLDDAGVCRVGSVRLRFVGPGRGLGIVGWSLHGLDASTDIDGVPTVAATAAQSVGAQSVRAQSVGAQSVGATHANGVTVIDHAVLMSPDLERTVDALRAIGMHPRRHRDGELGGAPIRQVFYRLGQVVLELVGSPDAHDEGPAHFWGLTFTVADIDASAGFLGENTGRVKDAVQPGRRITTLRHRALGLSVATALITPDVRLSRS